MYLKQRQIMTKITNSLSTGVHQVPVDGRTERLQIIPQIVSTLRLELFLWESNAQKTHSGLLKHKYFGVLFPVNVNEPRNA